MTDLVTVICTCHNHGRYVTKALNSVKTQSYKYIQLIIIDVNSKDDSAAEINNFLLDYPETEFIRFNYDVSLCVAFNSGLKKAHGKFIIDLSADDELLPGRVSEDLKAFSTVDESFGVVFSDIRLLDENQKDLGTHFRRDLEGNLIERVTDGDIYKILVERYYVPTPSMTIRKSLLDKLGGYDETLAYEDFDFWIRSSRVSKYRFVDKILTIKRVVKKSSSNRFHLKNQHAIQESTFTVCEKIKILNKTTEENEALGKRISYHLKHAFLTEHFNLVYRYWGLKKSIIKPTTNDLYYYILGKMGIRVNWVYKRLK